MKNTLIFLLLLIPIYNGFAQEVLWQKTIGGQHSDYLSDMVPTLDYGFLLAGSSLSDKTGNKNQNGNGNLDYYLWKMDKDGEDEWQLSFGGEGIDVLKSIFPTSDMGYILGGYSNSGISGTKLTDNIGNNDIWIVKINARGEEEWQKNYGGQGDDRLIKIKQTKDGGYIIVGTSNSNHSESKKEDCFGGVDFWIIKTDKTGGVEWERSYGGIYNDEPREIIEKDNGYIIGGISNSPKSGNKQKDSYGGFDIWVIELDGRGEKFNEFILGSENDDYLTSIINDGTDNTFTFCGNTYSEGENGNMSIASQKGSDFFVIKTDYKFNIKDQYIFDFKGNEILTSVTHTLNKSLLLSGFKIDSKTRLKSYVAVEINKQGEKLWEKEISTDGDDVLRKAVVTRDGGIVFAGSSTGKNAKYKTNIQGRKDYWVVKLLAEEKEKKSKIIIEAFPNPTEDFSQIVINHEYKEGVVNVFDLNGRLLYTEKLKYDMVALNFSSYPVGTYVVNIKTDVVNTSIKVIKK